MSIISVFAQESVELKNAGNEALRTKDYAKALESFEKAITVWGDQPTDFAMIYNAGVCAYQLKSFDKAITFRTGNCRWSLQGWNSLSI